MAKAKQQTQDQRLEADLLALLHEMAVSFGLGLEGGTHELDA